MKPATPRVLQVVWNLIRGGTEGQCARVALGLAEQGVKTRVAVSRREGFFLEPVEKGCGPVHHMDIHRRISWHTWMELRRLAAFVRTEQFDLIHAWDADAAIFGSVVARWTGRPLITSRRDLGEIYAPAKLRRMDRADRQAVAVVVNAEAIGSRVRTNGVNPARVHCIPNILDVEESDRLSAQPFSQRDRLGPGRWIGLVARLDPEKDVATLVRAAAHVVAEVPAARFAIVGDGAERARLETLAAELNLGDRVVFLGELTEVPSLLRYMDPPVVPRLLPVEASTPSCRRPALMPDSPNLLFTNAGMNQFVPIFLGQKPRARTSPAAPPTPRSASAPAASTTTSRTSASTPTTTPSSRCSATGPSATTSRKEAISWAWELLTSVWKFPPDRLFATIYQPDPSKGDPAERDQEAWTSGPRNFRSRPRSPTSTSSTATRRTTSG
jgi:hypothetical protein